MLGCVKELRGRSVARFGHVHVGMPKERARPQVVRLGVLADRSSQGVRSRGIGVPVAVERHFPRKLEQVCRGIQQGPTPGTSAVFGENVDQHSELVAHDGVHGRLGPRALVDLPEVAVHPGEVCGNAAPDSLGQSFGLIRRQGNQCATDGQCAEELTADHFVRVSRVRGLTGPVADGFPAA